jgi:hypothetical protein
VPFGSEEYYNYDIREPPRKIVHPDKIRETKKTVVNTTDWTNIPYYPTTREKRINVAKYLSSMGKQIPESLLKQLSEDSRKEIEEDAFNKISAEEPSINTYQEQRKSEIHDSTNASSSEKRIRFSPLAAPSYMAGPSIHRFFPPQPQTPPPYNAPKPRAHASARARLGGAY